MKSAYELAMERLEREAGPTKQLTEDERDRIADIDQKYAARIAEVKTRYTADIASNPNDAERLQAEMAEEVARLESQREAETSAIWDAAATRDASS